MMLRCIQREAGEMDLLLSAYYIHSFVPFESYPAAFKEKKIHRR